MKALRSLSAGKKRFLLFRQAAILFFCVSAFTFPLFGDDKDDLTAGARFDVTDAEGMSPLRNQARTNKSSAILILKWEQTHSPNFSGSFKTRKDYLTDVLSCILDTPFLGDFDTEETYSLTENLLKAGADPAAPHKDGFPVAYLAVKNDKASQFFIPLLIEYGAPVDAFNKYGETALYCAIAEDNIDLANFLLKRGADPNQKCKFGETALMAADSEDAINILINSGANPNLQDKEGETALMKKSYKHEFIRLLLKSGADPSIKDEKGRTVLHRWDIYVVRPVFDDLISHGCKIDEPDNEGFTPLIFYAFLNFSEEVLFLLEKGANPNYRNLKGRTALHEYLLKIEKNLRRSDVFEEKDKTVIEALLKAGTSPADKDNEEDSALTTAIRISRKNKNMAPLKDMVQKYASAEEIKMASVSAKKMVSAEKKQNAKEAVSKNLPSTLKALCILIFVGGLNYVTREVLFKNNPRANFMGPINAVLTLGGSGLVLGFIIGARQFEGTGAWADMFGPLITGVIGGAIGILPGILIACLPPVFKAFNKFPALYYIPTAVTAIIASVYIFRIWF
jgi:ankyrin repeat protein